MAWLVVVFALVVSGGSALAAVGPEKAIQDSVWTFEDGKKAGEARVKAESKDRGLASGLLVGTITGPIGVGILWALTKGDQMPADYGWEHDGKGMLFRRGFESSYSEITKKEKRKGRLIWGAVGSAVGIALTISISDSN